MNGTFTSESEPNVSWMEPSLRNLSEPNVSWMEPSLRNLSEPNVSWMEPWLRNLSEPNVSWMEPWLRNLSEPGARFRAAAPNHPEALLEEPQAFQAVGETFHPRSSMLTQGRKKRRRPPGSPKRIEHTVIGLNSEMVAANECLCKQCPKPSNNCWGQSRPPSTALSRVTKDSLNETGVRRDPSGQRSQHREQHALGSKGWLNPTSPKSKRRIEMGEEMGLHKLKNASPLCCRYIDMPMPTLHPELTDCRKHLLWVSDEVRIDAVLSIPNLSGNVKVQGLKLSQAVDQDGHGRCQSQPL